MHILSDSQTRQFSLLSLVCFALITLLAAPVPPGSPNLVGQQSVPAVQPIPLASSKALPTPPPIQVRPPARAPKPTLADFPVRSVLQLDGPVQAGNHAWNEEGVSPGPLRIVVDLAAQRVHVYREGRRDRPVIDDLWSRRQADAGRDFPILQGKRVLVTRDWWKKYGY